MARIFVSIGSNINRQKNIASVIAIFTEIFSAVDVSTIYQNKAVGFEGNDFYNLVIGFESDQSVTQLQHIFRNIETDHGRLRETNKFTPRTLDIDILLYDKDDLTGLGINVPRDEILRYPFILKPLAELAGQLIHPQNGKTYLSLWENMRLNNKSLLSPVEI